MIFSTMLCNQIDIEHVPLCIPPGSCVAKAFSAFGKKRSMVLNKERKWVSNFLRKFSEVWGIEFSILYPAHASHQNQYGYKNEM